MDPFEFENVTGRDNVNFSVLNSSEPGDGGPGYRLNSWEDPLVISQFSFVVVACAIGSLCHPLLIIYTISSFGKHIMFDQLFIYILFMSLGALAQISFGYIHLSRMYYGTWIFGDRLCTISPMLEIMGFYYRSAIVFAIAIELGSFLPKYCAGIRQLRAGLVVGFNILVWIAVDTSLYQYDIVVANKDYSGTNETDCLYNFTLLSSQEEEVQNRYKATLERSKFLWESLQLGMFMCPLITALIFLALYHILEEAFAGIKDLIRPTTLLAVCQLVGMSPGNAFSVWIRPSTRTAALVRGWNAGCVIFAFLAVIAEIPILFTLIYRLRSRKNGLSPVPNPGNSTALSEYVPNHRYHSTYPSTDS